MMRAGLREKSQQLSSCREACKAVLVVGDLAKNDGEVMTLGYLACSYVASSKDLPRGITHECDNFRSRNACEPEAQRIHQLAQAARRRQKKIRSGFAEEAAAHGVP